MGARLFMIIVVVLCVSCDSDSGSGDAYCHLGLASMQVAAGDVDAAGDLFDAHFNQVEPVDDYDDTIKLVAGDMTVTPWKTLIVAGIQHADLLMGQGWQMGIRLETRRGHFLYVYDMHPIKEDLSAWALYCVETTFAALGDGIDLIVTVDDAGACRVVGGRYGGVDVDRFFGYWSVLINQGTG